MIVLVVAGYRRGQRRVWSVDGVDQLTESGPLVQTEGYTHPSRFDLTILRIVRLVKLAQVNAAVARRNAHVVRPANVVLQLDVVAFSHGFDVSVDIVDGLA